MILLNAIEDIIDNNVDGNNVGGNDDGNYDDNECSLFLAPSKTFPGRGIVSSIDIDGDTAIDFSAITLPVPLSKISTWQLNNYVYASEDEDYAMCIFGMAMIFNHMNNDTYTAHHYWDESDNITKIADVLNDPSSTYNTVTYSIRKNFTVQAGHEVFATYGDENWFIDRGIEQIDIDINELEVYSKDELEKVGHCMTHVMIYDSDIPLSGRGLFAMRDFKKGEIVDITPVLLLPKHDVQQTANETVLMNYCITAPGLDIVLLPIGFSAAINHNTEYLSNLVLEWYQWSSDTDRKTKDDPLDELLKSEFSPLDIAFRAKRDILYGEELTINYGVEWIEEWASYLASTYRYNTTTNQRLFRHPIIAHDGFFPKHWFQHRDEL